MKAFLLVALFMGVKAAEIPDNVDFGIPVPVAPSAAAPIEETIVTHHIPPGLRGNMKLSTGEMKLFTGFALNIIRQKCKSVDSQKLFHIQKYIGKRISDTEPVRGEQSRDFQNLIQTMSTCAKGDASAPSPVQEKGKAVDSLDSAVRSIISRPMDFIRKVIPTLETIPEVDITTQDKSDDVEVLKVNGASPVSQQKGATFEKKLDQWHTLSHEEKKEAVESVFDDEELEKFAVTSPEPVTQQEIQYSTHVFIPMSKAPETGFVTWIANIWSSMSEFFGRIFGMGSRRRRETSEIVDPTPGRSAFIKLIDELCRIYCDTCSIRSYSQMNNFKLAARDLLKFLFEDKTGIDLVASHFLDPAFLRSLSSCEPSKN